MWGNIHIEWVRRQKLQLRTRSDRRECDNFGPVVIVPDHLLLAPVSDIAKVPLESDAPRTSPVPSAPVMHQPPRALIQALLEPGRFPDPAPRVELVQTPISRVLLAGGYAYKIKKPVTLPFSTLAQRRTYCANASSDA